MLHYALSVRGEASLKVNRNDVSKASGCAAQRSIQTLRLSGRESSYAKGDYCWAYQRRLRNAGWLKIRSFTEPVDNILRYSPWELKSLDQSKRTRVVVADSRRYKQGCLVRLCSYQDRDAVLELIGTDIVIARNQLPPTGEGEYYWEDLVGCVVTTQDNVVLGRVNRLIETGANDVLVLAGERERLIPFIPEKVIVAVDLANHIIRVDWDADF
jgi:16S rRNA processing protein RimM